MSEKEPFIRWAMVRFMTKAHFMRFIATIIVLVTISFIIRGKEVDAAWMGIVGMVLGYYFKGDGTGSSQHASTCPHCGHEVDEKEE